MYQRGKQERSMYERDPHPEDFFVGGSFEIMFKKYGGSTSLL